MVSIAAFQAVDPGSIPDRRKFYFKLFFLQVTAYFFFISKLFHRLGKCRNMSYNFYFKIFLKASFLFLSIREFGIPEDKKLEIQNLLIKLSYSEKAGNRQAAVWALGEMKVHREDAYLTVVRRLVDTDKGTREEAKKVLKTLTGITREDERYLFIFSF